MVAVRWLILGLRDARVLQSKSAATDMADQGAIIGPSVGVYCAPLGRRDSSICPLIAQPLRVGSGAAVGAVESPHLTGRQPRRRTLCWRQVLHCTTVWQPPHQWLRIRLDRAKVTTTGAFTRYHFSG
jgi:hypothetical protein